MAALSLLVADDHLLLRDTLIALLSARGGFQVTGAATLAETLNQISTHGRFDLVLLDIVMPGMNGLTGLAQVVAANAGGAVVAMSGNVKPGFVEQALQGGARGFVPKTLSPQRLAGALEFVASGGVYLPDDYRQSPAPQNLPGLTTQETRVLRYLCEGQSNKEIAREMDLTEITIKTHMRSVCLKLGAKNRTQAALIGAARLSANDQGQ